VERRLHTAGANKVRLDPFLPEKEEDVAWLKGMQGQLHELFGEWVSSRRGGKLVGTAEDLSPARCGPGRGPPSWAWWTVSAPCGRS